MPIKDKSVYPANWKEISRRIRFERAGGKCEQCGVSNYAIGARDVNGAWHDEDEIHSMNSDQGWQLFGEFPEVIKIVLTVAHLNHDTTDNRDANLAALCQRCHNRLDAPMRAKHSAVTRHEKKHRNQLALFESEASE